MNHFIKKFDQNRVTFQNTSLIDFWETLTNESDFAKKSTKLTFKNYDLIPVK